jgi:hypothetical protein
MSAEAEHIHVPDSAELAAIRAVHDMPFEAYAARFLKIRTKTQGLQPFRLNRGQLYIHEMAERQLRERQMVRIALLKARQWGGSTYIQGRFYRRITQGIRGQRAMITAHKADASANIFRMTARFHNGMDPRFRPYSRGAGLNKLVFPKRDSSYGVTTAGGESIGHSDTIQMFHGSEFALWPDPEEAMKGVFNTVPNGGNTEIWLESTGRGMGNAWHTTCMNARKGLGDFEFAFVPWFWFEEYERDPPKDMILSPEDEEYMEVFGLNLRQMAFRHLKILEQGGGMQGRAAFAQQYPSTPEEAFSADIEGSYISALAVLKARRARVQPYGIKVMGIDPAWQGKDRFSVVTRQGRKATKVGQWQGLRTTRSVGKVIQLIRQEKPAVVFVDSNGVGVGVVDPLLDMQKELGCRVVIVMAQETADDEDQYGRKWQECWGRMKNWFDQDQPVQLEDRTGKTEQEREASLDAWQGDITNPQVEYDVNNRPRRESKQKMKTRKVPSPDDGDALSLTFAFEVHTPPGTTSVTPEATEIRGYKRDEDGARRPPPNWRAV